MRRRSEPTGLVVAALAIAATTLLIYPLKETAPAVALGVVYLVDVLLVASLWGLRPGLLTAIGSTLAFNFFHLPPTGRFHIAEAENWVALAIFFAAAVVASDLARRVRRRADEADRERREADLSAEMARRLLRADDLEQALGDVAARVAETVGIPSASIERGTAGAAEGQQAFGLYEGDRRLGTLLVPDQLPETTSARLRERTVPALEALLAAAFEREELLGNRVEAAALRRSDVVKTALLRTVSHDLRSPLTAILTAAEPLGARGLGDEERRELSAVVREEAERLSRLIDNLLDLSRLEADAAEPRLEWCDVGEVISSAADAVRDADVQLQVSRELPFIRADAAQLERAFANLLENAARHGAGHPVLVRAWPLHNRIIVRIVDRGPGISLTDQAFVFEPFYRGKSAAGHRGSGLGLAIARGFVEANRGRVNVESSAAGTAFVVEFPVERAAVEGDPHRSRSFA